MNHWKSLTFYRYVGSVMFLYNDEFYLRSTNAADPLRDRFIAATLSKRKDNSQWLILLDQWLDQGKWNDFPWLDQWQKNTTLSTHETCTDIFT